MRTVAPNDPEDGAIGTVPRIAGLAKFAFSAARIDFTDHPLPQQLVARRFLHHANKLVTNRPFETSVPFGDFEIRIADPGKVNTHQRLIATIRLGNFLDRQFLFLDSKGFHKAVDRKQKAEYRSLSFKNSLFSCRCFAASAQLSVWSRRCSAAAATPDSPHQTTEHATTNCPA